MVLSAGRRIINRIAVSHSLRFIVLPVRIVITAVDIFGTSHPFGRCFRGLLRGNGLLRRRFCAVQLVIHLGSFIARIAR